MTDPRHQTIPVVKGSRHTTLHVTLQDQLDLRAGPNPDGLQTLELLIEKKPPLKPEREVLTLEKNGQQYSAGDQLILVEGRDGICRISAGGRTLTRRI